MTTMAQNRPTRVFSFAEANSLVPSVADLTEEVIQELDGIRRRSSDAEQSEAAVSDTMLQQVEAALQRWSERVMELGGRPKGYFTVDFQSIDPELLYCWTYGEDRIHYTHKVWENFSHRRPLADSVDVGGDHMKWVN
jgi:hypothetical protein